MSSGLRIKQPILLIVSGILLLVVLWFVVERISFLSTAKKASGKVKEIHGTNQTCGSSSSRRRYSSRRYPCTKFKASIEFYNEQKRRVQFTVSAGSNRGHNSSTTLADYRLNQPVSVVYDPKQPSKAYINTFMGVWGIPFMLFIFQILSFIASFMSSKRKT